MRVLGLDIGDSMIGVAISDPLEIIAQGLSAIKRTNIRNDVASIKNIIATHEIQKIIVGLPITTNGKIGIQAQKVMGFADLLKKESNLPVIMYDERFTTAIADQALIEADMRREKRKKVIDKVSAILILQGYLDKHPQNTKSRGA